MARKQLSLYLSLIAVLAASAPCALSAEEMPLELGPVWAPKALASPMRLVELSRVRPAFELQAADEATVRPIAAWNTAGMRPLRNGVERVLPEARLVVLEPLDPGEKLKQIDGAVSARSSDDNALVWAMALRVGQAWRMRIRLGDVRLPSDTQMWVYGEDGEAVGPFGTELMGPDGTLWTPSIGGPEIRLEIRVPDAAWDNGDPPSFRVEAVTELFPLEDTGMPHLGGSTQPKDTSCLVDAACVGTNTFSTIDLVKRGVAYLEFMDGGSGYICTGSLVTDSDQSSYVPYLLTANHCFASQSAASTLEAFFDYIQSPCGGTAPSLLTLPRSNGSTLLKTSTVSDFTFVRLNQLPSGRVFLGWRSADPANGTVLHRVTHPLGLPAAYTQASKVASPPGGTCGLSTTNYHFAQFLIGGTFGGSSGGALITDSGQIVGQLGGGCGPDPSNGCDYSNYDYDGKFSKTFPNISQYINVEGGGGTPCVQNLNNGVVCLRNGRFEFVGSWTDFANPANTNPLIWTPVENINATAGFQNNPSGIQIVMRVADGCSMTGTWWVWLGGFTDAGWNITVRDTVTNKQRTFSKSRSGGVFPTTTRDSTTFTCN